MVRKYFAQKIEAYFFMKHLFIFLIAINYLQACAENGNEESELIEFNGVHLANDNYEIIDRPLEGNQQKAALIAVLVYYGVPIEYKEGIIFIHRSELEDMNYLWNLTNKSKDSVWFKEHISPE